MTERWDDPAGGGEDDRRSPWDEPADETTSAAGLSHEQREVGLVALQAAVLARRIYLPATRPGELSPEQWQVLLAVALIESSGHGRPAASLGSLARLLTLSAEEARDCLAALIDSGHVTVARDAADEDRGERLRWTATPRGLAAAGEYLERAGRFLPGWPPR
jgi:DNA-binding MarR family transcriptional regulator